MIFPAKTDFLPGEIRVKNRIAKRMKEKRARAKSDDIVYEKLKTALRKRYIKQGSKLVEDTLAKQLGVSRTPVRSAIQRLEMEGLVTTVANRGAFVITPTMAEIKETFQVRAALECKAIELAVRKVNSKELAGLRQLIDREHTILAENRMEDYWPNNDAIHLKIAAMSGNKVLVSYVHELLDRSSLYLVLYDPFSRLEYCPLAEHEKIFTALQSGNTKEVRQAMEEHLKSSTAYAYLAEDIPEDYISLS
ncbi:MAG: GntR family transcriptional regulator [Desulfobacterales bacterium]|nr:MAG: GntR family transcriptional regulator [Desulfobacterales bacterium]